MPFISKDWRSPGELWVKTTEGWEKKKILECRFKAIQEEVDKAARSCDENKENSSPITILSDSSDDDDSPERSDNSECSISIQPHCHITIKCTREIAGFNRLSDALKRLDFPNAVRDIRRFYYTCKLLEMLITQNLTTMSGCAQRVLFTMLEEVACQVSSSQQNIHVLQRLLRSLEKTLIEYYCWGRPVGSSQLWEQHLQSIARIHSIAKGIRIREPSDDTYPKLQNLPEECVREVLLRLNDHKDLEASSEAYTVMEKLVDEKFIWRELVSFHFTPQQVSYTLQRYTELENSEDWKQIYHRLRKTYGLREDYAEVLQLCRNCRCLFWPSIGHPCIADQDPQYQEKLQKGNVDKSSLYIPIPPTAFLKFFSL